MNTQKAINAVIEMVPNWYRAKGGRYPFQIRVGEHESTFYTQRWLTPALQEFREVVQDELPRLIKSVRAFPETVGIELIQEYFAEQWLRQHDPDIQWRKLFEYNRALQFRTYENTEIGFNIVIGRDQGRSDITQGKIQKLIDPLASSNSTYFVVDQELQFVDYREIRWSDIKEVREYKFHPEFLHPFFSVLGEKEWSAHKTNRGDLVILKKSGLAAAKRKGRWKIYDSATLKNSISDCVGDYRVGCNLFEIVFDLSFRRHGALLVFDQDKKLLPHIANPESVFGNANQDTAREMLHDSVGLIPMGAATRSERKKSLFLEVASLDGAVIFTKEKVLAVGAMIRTHPDVNALAGARSTAALSAYKYGGRPIKVSSDGEITVYFASVANGHRFDAQLEFL
jgi:hypothetical protein